MSSSTPTAQVVLQCVQAIQDSHVTFLRAYKTWAEQDAAAASILANLGSVPQQDTTPEHFSLDNERVNDALHVYNGLRKMERHLTAMLDALEDLCDAESDARTALSLIRSPQDMDDIMHGSSDVLQRASLMHEALVCLENETQLKQGVLETLRAHASPKHIVALSIVWKHNPYLDQDTMSELTQGVGLG